MPADLARASGGPLAADCQSKVLDLICSTLSLVWLPEECGLAEEDPGGARLASGFGLIGGPLGFAIRVEIAYGPLAGTNHGCGVWCP